MVSLPIDPTTSVPTIERTSARPEPIQSAAPVDSFNRHLERAQTRDTTSGGTTTQPTNVEESEPTATEEEQVHTDLPDSQTDSTEGAETEEAGEAKSGESESEQDEQTESSNTQDVVEISTDVLVVDETLELSKQAEVEESSEDGTTETKSTEQAKSNRATPSNSELPDAPEDSTGKQQPSPDQLTDSPESSAAESIPATDASASESELQQVASVKNDTPDGITTSDQPSGELSNNKESEQQSQRLAQLSQQQPQQQPQQQAQQQQTRASTRSAATAKTKHAEASDDSTEETATVPNAQSSKPQALVETQAERDLTGRNQSKSQTSDKIEASGKLAPHPSGTEPRGEEGMTTNRPTTRLAAATSTAETTTTEPPQNVNRVRFVQRVARAFQSVGREGGEVRLRLSPPELGALRLEITVQRGVLTARLETETQAARTLILDNIPALRERLEQQDIKIASFDVDLMEQPPEGMRDNPSDDAQWQREYRERGSRESESAVEPSPSGSTDPFQLGSDGALNIVV